MYRRQQQAVRQFEDFEASRFQQQPPRSQFSSNQNDQFQQQQEFQLPATTSTVDFDYPQRDDTFRAQYSTADNTQYYFPNSTDDFYDEYLYDDDFAAYGGKNIQK